jgi:hypothetical protein
VTTATTLINAPGVYDLPIEAYHRDPVEGGSLSSSGARKLLPPSCPAKFKHWITEGQQPSREFDIGHAAHKLILGAGPELVVVEAENYRTKAAQQLRDEAHAAGAVPLLEYEYEQVAAMAAALKAHPLASALLSPARGKAEQTLVWFDAEFGVWRRALLDFLPDLLPGRRFVMPDYKTTRSAAPGDVPRAMASYGYHQQLDWYLGGVKALGLAGDQEPVAVLIFQEKTAPYLVTIVQPDSAALDVGRTRNRKALDVYRTCTETGEWPGYGDAVQLVTLPGYAQWEHFDAEERGDFATNRGDQP